MKKTDTPREDRRKFLSRNLVAIAAIAASGLAKSSPASAYFRDDFEWGRKRHSKNCFLKGTKIRTLHGERKIEDLVAGDLLPTVFGGSRPIQSIGRYSYRKTDPSTPWAREEKPIRIARSALGPNVPQADLFVSSWHALLIDGLLVPAGNLVNGTTIAEYDANELVELEFFHIKLDSHDVIYAEGAQCESLSRVTAAAEAAAASDTEADAVCAPLVYYEGRRGQIVSRVRSAISPWLDIRSQLDVIRDRLESRGLSLLEAA
jgi:hypothetical protein